MRLENRPSLVESLAWRVSSVVSWQYVYVHVSSDRWLYWRRLP